MNPELKLNGGQGNIELLPDGTVKVTIRYQLGLGIQMPPGTVIVVEEAFKPSDALADSKQMDLMRLAEAWKTS